MKLKELLSRYSLRATGRELGYDIRLIDGQLHVDELYPHPLWAKRLSAKSSFCRAVVQSGLLSRRQMVHAALRYRLGRSKDDAVIYWQIDHHGNIHDGKLMWYGPDCHRLKHRSATWVMHLLKHYCDLPSTAFQPTHCLFGLHLLSGKAYGSSVCIVEAEKSAVILSERYPQCIWLAAGGLFELQVDKFIPLQRYRVVLFPDTDPSQDTFNRWYAVAQQVMHAFFWPRGNPIHVSPILELHATDEQKRRKIDLVDFLAERENSPNPTPIHAEFNPYSA